MAKRRQKTRTHKKVSEEELAKIPRSMVIRLGSSLKNNSLTQLVKDVRNLMQPHTAINLRERKNNKLKDFVVMAGPLGVSHLMVFSQNDKTGSIHLRLARMPRGPTITFKVLNYSLNKDVCKTLRHPKSVGKDSALFLEPPLLVLNGFANPQDCEPHEKVLITTFQNMFPAISAQQTKVQQIKRVLMINKDATTGEINIRHYAIDTKLVEVSKNVKKLITAKTQLKKNLPNLSNSKDVSDLILDPYAAGGYTSESEIEEDSIVEIQNDNLSKIKQKNKDETVTKKRAIKLTELGPRLNLKLVKLEDGICEGKVLHHESISKSKKEIKELEAKHAAKQKLKEARREKQMENIKQKNEAKEAKKLRRKNKRLGETGDGDGEGENEQSESDNESDDDEDSDADENKIQIRPEDYEDDSDLYSDIE